MLAGVVNVDLYADDLFIRGDRSGNEISISLDPDLGATVKGGEGTRVEFSKNATAPINIALLNSIFIFMGSGDDVVAIDGNNPIFNGNISVQLAGGDDTLFFVGDSQQKDSIANDVRIHTARDGGLRAGNQSANAPADGPAGFAAADHQNQLFRH